MTPATVLALLQEFYRDRLTLRARHEAGARLVSAYEFNNTYQYIIAREDTHLAWVRDAIARMGGAVPEQPAPAALPAEGRDDARVRAVFEDDARRARAFVDAWRERIAAVTHARHRIMLQVILGETREHLRFFEQALAGRTDLLGRRPAGAGTGGVVLPTRWLE